MIFEDFCTRETLLLTIFLPWHLRVSCLRLAYP
jgi:hypothetical protein